MFADIMRKYGVIITAGALKPPQGMMQSEAAECEFSAVCSLPAARLWKDEQLDPSANLTLPNPPPPAGGAAVPAVPGERALGVNFNILVNSLNKSQQKVRRAGRF